MGMMIFMGVNPYPYLFRQTQAGEKSPVFWSVEIYIDKNLKMNYHVLTVIIFMFQNFFANKI
jgi:hypothetical protein